MAANLQGVGGLANLGKRLAGQIRCRAISQLSPRSVHGSAYDKNPEENVVSTVVPDHVMPPQAEEYWAPHPKTGVFGPATDEVPGGSGRDSVCYVRRVQCWSRRPSFASLRTWRSHPSNLELQKYMHCHYYE